MLLLFIAAAAYLLVAAATRPISLVLGLIQTISFLGLLFGLVGWFGAAPDFTFLWYIAGCGALWLFSTFLQSNWTT
ncbi:hypothetical protein [Citricoccus sp. I39-566]|uniref:hypothetical protein n=1 Tax=Citricoccus sp. I39-566 TaxID=3073268 RepID=UPI00286CB6A7|nr:hypothetical protein [Citricoccus sp. I39-566]WMY80050.1 hypothetical protein RE421_16680 [Citricoccus sp. I39-566]